jgi:hypothetical protein
MEHREAFSVWLEKTFSAEKKVGSKVLTRRQVEEVKAYLCGAAPAKDAHFKHWVRSRGFRLVDYPVLGLHNVVCLPAKTKVNVYEYVLLVP